MKWRPLETNHLMCRKLVVDLYNQYISSGENHEAIDLLVGNIGVGHPYDIDTKTLDDGTFLLQFLIHGIPKYWFKCRPNMDCNESFIYSAIRMSLLEYMYYGVNGDQADDIRFEKSPLDFYVSFKKHADFEDVFRGIIFEELFYLYSCNM